MPDLTPYLEDNRVVHGFNDFRRRMSESGRWPVRVSDVISGPDDDEVQYVDLVMEGGGVLGVALVGYTHALEKCGIRFRSVAGTSAGAINAMLVAAMGRPHEAKSERILDAIADKNFYDFVDGDHDAKKFVRWMLEPDKNFWELYVEGTSRVLQIRDNLQHDMGLNPGDAFRDWLRGVIGTRDVTSLDSLHVRMSDYPEDFRHRTKGPIPDDQLRGQIQVVTAELTTRSKIVLPKHAELFYANPGAVNPAEFVRASMSIPIFFHPVTLDTIPRGAGALERWATLVGYKGDLPERTVFVDGGIQSNFPISLFHRPGGLPPRLPTLGAKLGAERDHPHEIRNVMDLLTQMFSASRAAADFEFLWNNPDYQKLVTVIDTGSVNWLNFDLPLEDKVDLFSRGFLAGLAFLEHFEWERYRESRAPVAAVTPG